MKKEYDFSKGEREVSFIVQTQNYICLFISSLI